MDKLIYVEYKAKINNIKEKFESKLTSITDETNSYILEDYTNDLELKKDDKLYITFIGQYSAGKSSIISALTKNESIKIGQNITTDKATEYKWNDLILIDTPGIGTQNLNHDDIAYKYMDIADLLVYVVTVQGFDDIVANDFRKIAFEQKKSQKMMLVVNKTSLESMDNKPNWENHIKKVIAPLTLKDLKVTFIDARDYLDSLEETDMEDKLELEVISNFEEFIKNINNFVKEKNLIGKLLSQLNIIQHYVNIMLDQINLNNENDNIKELLDRKKIIVEESKHRVNKSIENKVDNLYEEIIEESNKLVDKLSIIREENEFEDAFNEMEDFIDKKCNECGEFIENIFVKEIDDLIKEINLLSESRPYKEILNNLNVDKDFNIKYQGKKNINYIKRISNKIKPMSKFLGLAGNGFNDWCVNANKVGDGLKIFSGSNAHKTVLNIGHRFGKKFKPYEAVKIVDKIDNIGKNTLKLSKGLEFIGAIASPLIAIYEEYEEDKYENNIRKARIETRANFKKVAKEIKDYFKNETHKIIKDIYDEELNNIRSQNEELIKEESIKAKNEQDFLKINKEIDYLSKKIESLIIDKTKK